MKTIEVTLYEFNELDEEAKETAIEDHRQLAYKFGPAWTEENRESMEKFAEVFPVKVTNWSYGGRGEGVTFRFTCEDEIEQLSGQRLATYIWNNYRHEIFKPKQYWICCGHKNVVGVGAKHRNSKVQLYEKYQCPLTGYYMDDCILAPVYKFLDKPTENTDFDDLMRDCFAAWIKACNADVDSQFSDKYLSEELVTNEYEFTENGKKF